MAKLNKEILQKLIKRTNNKESSIRVGISLMKRRFPNTTMNAAAQLLAQSYGFSVLQKLKPEDKASLPQIEIPKPKLLLRRPSKEKLIETVNYPTSNPFVKANIDEINRTYTHKCYTAAFILCRKLIENLLIENILRKKYPKQNNLYFNRNTGKREDFSVIIKNLHGKSTDFAQDKSLVERLCIKCKEFKDDANEKTHSWYHVVNKTEFDSKDIQEILNLIAELEGKIR